MSTTRVLVIGEALLDFIPPRSGALSEQNYWEVHSGGAPANVATGLAYWGLDVVFASVIGSDGFGQRLVDGLVSAGVDCSLVRRVQDELTGLCFVTLDDDGERRFNHRGGHPFSQFQADDLNGFPLDGIDVLHFGCGGLRNAQTAQAVLKAIESINGVITCDPGCCPPAWGPIDEVYARVRDIIGSCHIFKCSLSDAQGIFGPVSAEEAVRAARHHGARHAIVTDGGKGSWLATGDSIDHVASPPVRAVDATGAGDAYMAALLAHLPPGDGLRTIYPRSALLSAMNKASKAGAQAVTMRGATSGQRASQKP